MQTKASHRPELMCGGRRAWFAQNVNASSLDTGCITTESTQPVTICEFTQVVSLC